MIKKITLLNQVTGPLFIDIANEYAEIYDEVILVTGIIEPTYAPLDDKVKVVYKTTYKRNKSYLRILTWLLFFMQTYFYFLFKKKQYGEEVLIVTNPPILPFLGSILFSKRKLKFKVLVYDVYPDALANFNYIKKTSFIYKYWDIMNKKAYSYADQVITIGSLMKKVIARNVESSKIKIIYPWVNTSIIKPIKKDDNWFIKKNNLFGKKIILYSGNMGLTHDLMTVLKAAKDLQEITSYFHFLFIGDGPKKQNLVKYQKINKLLNVSFLPYQDPEVLPFSFASADFGIVTLGTGAEGLSVPSKTFYLLSAGSVIIAISESGSEIEKLINDNDCGISIKPKDKKSLIHFLLNSNEKDINRYKFNSRILSENFTKKNAKQFL